MKTKYIHIGLPKNLSTTLQRDYFNVHPEIHHLGVGVGSNIDYVNSKISSACENHFQYSKNFSYLKRKGDIQKLLILNLKCLIKMKQKRLVEYL